MPTASSSRRVLPSRNARAENINYSDTLIAPADGVGYREEDPSEVLVGGVSGVGEVDHNENYNVYGDDGGGDNYGDEVSWTSW